MAAVTPPFLIEAISFLSASVVAVPLSKKLGLGSVIGYLAAGALVGPSGFGFIASAEEILKVAELGIVLLLFVIGLELELKKLWQMRQDIFVLGTAQVFMTGMVLTYLSKLAGFSFDGALIIGFGLALSSTAFAVQILQERGQLSSHYGQRAFAILLLQDIAIVPLLAMVSMLSPHDGSSTQGFVLSEALTTLGAVAAVILIGRYLTSPVFSLLARSRAREIMLTAALLIALGSGAIMHAVGLSMALGAFLAGVLLAETSFKHALEADIEPFRSLLMGLFFVAVGMSLNFAQLLENWIWIAFSVVVVMTVKASFFWALTRLSGSSTVDAFRIAVTLPQGGEFAFVLFAAAVSGGILSAQTNNALNSIVILTMLLTPLACAGLEFAARHLKARGIENPAIETFDNATPRVLVIGFGRFGMTVARFLNAEGLEVVAIDNSSKRIGYAAKLGYKVYYGDATRPDVLELAGAGQATLIALCIENEKVMMRSIDLIRQRFPAARLFCRAKDRSHEIDLVRKKVEYHICETFESSIAFGRAVLFDLGIPEDRIAQVDEDVRQRDREWLQTQLEEGLCAAGKTLHGMTPRS